MLKCLQYMLKCDIILIGDNKMVYIEKRKDRIKVVEKEPVTYNFTMGKIKEKHENPFMQAAYLYSLIRNEVNSNGSR